MRVVLILFTLSACCCFAGCNDDSRSSEQSDGHRVKVRAPYTDVDVNVPDKDKKGVDVDVEVGH